MTTSIKRLANIDIIKFLSIIIMVIDHMILVLVNEQLNIPQSLFFAYVPLCQMGFLFSSGYLMALSFNKEKFNKYIFRIALFVLLFLLMTFLTNEKIFTAGSILLNFAISIAISLFFLYRNKLKDLIVFTALLFGLDIIWQILMYFDISTLNNIMSNYPYPINSFSLYFFVGIILFSYRDKVGVFFKTKFAKWITVILLAIYSYIFYIGIYVNDYSYYLHLPVLLLSSMFIGLYYFYLWENTKLPKVIHLVIIKIADALLYIYVIHYIILFRWLINYNLNWWQLSIIIILIIVFSVSLQNFVNYVRKTLFKSSLKI